MEMTNDTIHDLRNVIASIKAYVQILKMKIEKNTTSENLDYLTKIDEKADVLTSMVNTPQSNSSQKEK